MGTTKMVVGPAWTRGEIEAPKGEKNMGTWTAAVYTAEQQARLGVDEASKQVAAAPAASELAAYYGGAYGDYYGRGYGAGYGYGYPYGSAYGGAYGYGRAASAYGYGYPSTYAGAYGGYGGYGGYGAGYYGQGYGA